jgi:hypothetical protein
VSADREKTIVLWDVPTGRPLAEMEALHEGGFTACISPDGKRIATVGLKDHQALLWEADNKRVIWAWRSKRNLYGPITWLPDGRNFVTAVEQEGAGIVRFDEGADAPKWLWEAPSDGVFGVSPDGRLALLQVGMGPVRAYDLGTGREFGEIALPTREWAGMALPTRVSGPMAVSPDARYGVAAADSPPRLYVFRLPDPPAKK